MLAARPEVFNHNIETVRRLHRRMRGAKASYDKALWLLRRAKELADYPVLTKSGIIVGLGETNDEVVETMRDLRAHGVDVVTIGQYLQPSAKHATIDRWVHPDEFRWFREQGEALGFGSVFAGPLVRSSYRADEQKHAAAIAGGQLTGRAALLVRRLRLADRQQLARLAGVIDLERGVRRSRTAPRASVRARGGSRGSRRPGWTRTCAESAGKPEPTSQTWRSWSAATCGVLGESPPDQRQRPCPRARPRGAPGRSRAGVRRRRGT